MRIMAISDLHGNLEGLDPSGADVVVLAGDIAPLKGRGLSGYDSQKRKHSSHKKFPKNAFRPIKSGVV